MPPHLAFAVLSGGRFEPIPTPCERSHNHRYRYPTRYGFTGPNGPGRSPAGQLWRPSDWFWRFCYSFCLYG